MGCRAPEEEDFLENEILISLNEARKQEMEDKKKTLEQIQKKLQSFQDDSLKKEIYLDLSYEYLMTDDSLKFREVNHKATTLSRKLNDSEGLASAYWDLAEFYYKKNRMDSAYHFWNQAQKTYTSLNNHYKAAQVLLNMAIVQKNIKDYTGSEVTTFQAISVFEPLNKYKYLYRAYNNLGFIYEELEEYEKSFLYYKTAEEFIDKADMEYLYPSLWNNIGLMLKNSGRFERAAFYFDQALNYIPDLQNSNEELYAMILDNQAHNQLKQGDTISVLPRFNIALAIREKEKIRTGIIVSNLHLAEYYLFKEDSLSAFQHALTAKELAGKSQDYRDLLKSLMVLSKIDQKNALEYTQQYIQINDNLQKKERETRNKFARIRYETAGYIAKSEKLSDRIKLIAAISAGTLSTLGLLFVLFRQRSRNKELKLVQQKQMADREVYDMVMNLQQKFEEGREKEKNRIARELHDGILSKLFGVRINLDILNQKEDENTKEKRFSYIEEIKDIALEIRTLSHELSGTPPIAVNYESVLEEHIAQQNHSKTEFELDIGPKVDFNTIEADVKINLFRVIQECIQNIHKHAEATKAKISLKQTKKHLEVVIEDNGKGFDPKKTNTGIGMKNIRERAKEMGAKLTIDSGGAGSKTKITLLIPIL